MQARLFQASALYMISQSKARYLWMRLGKLGYRKREPAELDLLKEKASLLAELFNVHRQSFGFSIKSSPAFCFSSPWRSTPATVLSLTPPAAGALASGS